MAKKKEMDNLAKDAAAALAAGMSYGRWKAMQNPVVIEKRIKVTEDSKICPLAEPKPELEVVQKVEPKAVPKIVPKVEPKVDAKAKRDAEMKDNAERVRQWEENRKKVQYGQA